MQSSQSFVSETKETKISTSFKLYPSFNPPHLARLSRYHHENCLAYALNHTLEGPNFYSLNKYEFRSDGCSNNIIKFVASEINSHFKNNDLIIPSPHTKRQFACCIAGLSKI